MVMNSQENEIYRGFMTNPLVFIDAVGSTKTLIDRFMPYSFGMEIETCPVGNIGITNADIADKIRSLELMHVDINNYEQRFRFKPGLEGAIQLYETCKILQETMSFNVMSGIHYHIDFTDCWNVIDRNRIKELPWILEELNEWDYRGTYNRRQFGEDGSSSWIRWNSIQTLEFRIGNMTFDYREIIKRVVSAQSISTRIKAKVSKNPKLLELQQKMRKLNATEEEEVINKENILDSRIIRI